MKNKEKLKHSRYGSFGESCELRAIEPTEDTGYIVEGYAIIYEEMTSIGGWFNEVIKRGALDGADLKDVPMFIHHKGETIPLARSRKNNKNSTLQLTPDKKGLYFRAELDVENNVDAKALYSSIKRGDISGMSYSFRVKTEKWLNIDDPVPTREIYEFSKIGEISALWSPAYEATSIEARAKELESSDKVALDNARATLDNEKSVLEVERLKLKIKFGGNK
ncbi:MAG TPA: HK97 family phage prohead protease [Thermoclostridium sp.]|nr:HK97 family phage prohead protease [Thermoclostridium sp.]